MENIKDNLKYLACTGLIIFMGFFFSHCGGENSGSTGSSGPSDNATAGQTAVTTTSNLLASMQSLMGPSASESSHLRSNGTSGESSDDGHMSDCSYNETAKSYTCRCEGGGTVTWTYQENITQLTNGENFSVTTTETFSDCVMPVCDGTSKTINGQASGSFSGSYQNNTWSGTFEHRTAAECEGITVDEVKIGFLMQGTYDSSRPEGQKETFSGYICIDGQKITFNSHEELEEQVDKDDMCKTQ